MNNTTIKKEFKKIRRTCKKKKKQKENNMKKGKNKNKQKINIA